MAITQKMRKAILDLSDLKDQSITLQEFSRQHGISYKGLIYHINIMSKKFYLTRDELIKSPKCIKEYIEGYNKPEMTLESKVLNTPIVETTTPKVEPNKKPKHYLDILFDRCQILLDETNTLLNEAKLALKEDDR